MATAHLPDPILRILHLSTVPAPDSELLARFANTRDETAFAAMVERHGPLVLATCRRMLLNAADADDAFQAVFLALAQHAGAVRNRSSLAAWLYGAAFRICQNLRRKQARSRTVSLAADHPGEGDPLADISAREFMGILDEELARLPDRYRLPILLCLVEGLSQEEAAARLEWSPGSVKGRLERGREKLRQRLNARGVSLSALVTAAASSTSGAVPTALFTRVLDGAAGRAVSPAVIALAASAVRSGAILGIASVVMVCTAMIAVAFAASGSSKPETKPEPAPAPRLLVAADAPARTDRFGDPLPDGAVMRLGTIGLRVPNVAGVGFRKTGELVAFSEYLKLYVWPADGSGKPHILKLPGEKKFLSQRALSPDARFAAVSEGREKKLILYDVSGKEPIEYLSRELFARDFAFSPDGAWLAIGGSNDASEGLIHFCDLRSKQWHQLSLHGPAPQALSFTRNGKSLVVTTSRGVVVFDTAERKERFRKMDLGRIDARYASMSPDGSTLAVLPSGFIHGPKLFVHFFSVASGKEIEGRSIPTESAYWVDFSPDGKRLLLGSPRGIREWDPTTGKLIREIDGPARYPPSYSNDHRKLASHSWSAVLFWDTKSGKHVRPDLFAAGHTEAIMGVTVSPDGKLIATNASDGDVRMWSATNGNPLFRVRAAWGNQRRVAFLPDSKSFVTVAEDLVTPVVYDAQTGRELRRFVVPPEMAKSEMLFGDVGLSGDGKKLTAWSMPTTGQGKSYDVVWDVASGKIVDRRASAEGGREEQDVVYSRDGRWVANSQIVSRIGAAERIDLLPNGTCRRTKFSDDSRLVAASRWPVSKNNNQSGVVVYDLVAKKQIADIPTGYALNIAISPNNRELAAVTSDEVSLWDIKSAKPIRRFTKNYSKEVERMAIAFTRDGRRLITGHDDCTALVWDLSGTGRAAGDPAPRLSAAELARLWDMLACDDPAKAHTAGWELTDRPDQAVGLLRERLKPIQPADEALVRALIAKLDAPAFADRETANKMLRDLGDSAIPPLRAALKGQLSAEQKGRIERLLTEAAEPILPGGTRLRELRAVALLDRIGTADARKLLKELAGGMKEARLTKEAAATIR